MQNSDQANVTLRNRVLHIRRAQGLSQAELARRAGLSRETVRIVERNHGYLAGGAVMLALCIALRRRLEQVWFIEPDLFDPNV